MERWALVTCLYPAAISVANIAFAGMLVIRRRSLGNLHSSAHAS